MLFRTWVSGSINLQQASQRNSARFNRSTFSQTLNREIIRRPSERLVLQRSGQRIRATLDPRLLPQLLPGIDTSRRQGVSSTQLIPVFYKEGPLYFKFEKIKESSQRLAASGDDLIRLARQFLIENNFLVETASDKVGRAIVQERRINEDSGENRRSVEYIVQQDVVFERYFDGKPVINSKIRVGFLPESREIVLFEHFNWTPLQEQSPQRISPDDLRRNRAGSPQEIFDRLQEKVIRTSGNTFKRAEVRKVVSSWFQTESRLIPVIGFEVFVEFEKSNGTYSESYFEVINLLGNDDILYHQRTPSNRPTKATN